MNWKETYTKVFLKAADKSINALSVKEYLSVWWKNTRTKDTGGLRLTDEGFRFITEDIELTTYEIPYPRDFELTTNVVIWMDNFIDCPYYLGRREIIVTNEKKAMELHLFSGDIRKYGLTKALSRHNNDNLNKKVVDL
jgi:hypothetical protein|tara:strand:+ start:198 stop:611 length:414 start_codon:yes stop_codon:yes gene_type:complete